MQISGNFSVSRTDTLGNAPQKSVAPQTQSASSPGLASPVDQLELSPEALAVSGNDSSGEVFRADKVAELRQAIANGNYDTDEKISKALDNFLDQL